MAAVQGIIGIVGLIVLAWAISENRRFFPWRTAVVGLGRAVRPCLAAPEAPSVSDRIRLDRQRRERARSCNRGRHILRVRFYRRRPAAL